MPMCSGTRRHSFIHIPKQFSSSALAIPEQFFSYSLAIPLPSPSYSLTFREAPALPHPTTLKAMLQGSQVGERERRLQHASTEDSNPSGESEALCNSFSPKRLDPQSHGGRPAQHACHLPPQLNFIQRQASCRPTFLHASQGFSTCELP